MPCLFSNRPENNTNLVKDVEFLLSVECRKTPFSGCMVKVVNVSDNQ